MATLKTAQSPLPQQTLAQWRTEAGIWIGQTYASMNTDQQTTFDRLLNEAHDYISKRAAHQPWGTEETTVTITAGTDTLYAMPASFRHPITISEEETNGQLWPTDQSEKEFFLKSRIASQTTHPWAIRTKAVWFFDGWTTAEPPVQQWRRIGVDRTGATARILFRPYFGLLVTSGQDSYTPLPASEVPAIRHEFQYQWSLFKKNFEQAAVYRQAREDAIAANEVNDHTTTEASVMQGVASSFSTELS